MFTQIQTAKALKQLATKGFSKYCNMVAEPILIFDGRKWDLSNLCPSGSAPLSPTVSKYSRTCSGRPCEASLYPSLDELYGPACDVEPAAEVFRRVSSRMPSNEDKNERRSSHNEARTADTSHRNSAPLYPSLDEIESQETRGNQGSQSSKESRSSGGSRRKSRHSRKSHKSHSKRSDSRKKEGTASTPGAVHSCPTSTVVPGAVATTANHPAEQKARLKSENAAETLPSTRSLQPDASSRSCMSEQVTHHQEVEVAPGEYMPLRGSAETLKAIESGKACKVTCFACQASLWCVPDADLVLCPDCRILSPLSSKESSQLWTRHGGVGLGARVE
jgi:hypothetical protein